MTTITEHEQAMLRDLARELEGLVATRTKRLRDELHAKDIEIARLQKELLRSNNQVCDAIGADVPRLAARIRQSIDKYEQETGLAIGDTAPVHDDDDDASVAEQFASNLAVDDPEVSAHGAIAFRAGQA
jgi:hypothetical protein